MYIHVYPIILYYIQERNLRRPRKQEARSKKQEARSKKQETNQKQKVKVETRFVI